MVLAVEGLSASYGEGDAAPGGAGLVAAAVGRAVGFVAGRRGTRASLPPVRPDLPASPAQAGGHGRTASTAPVFSEVTFHLAQGEMACLVGPSGVGKTTLLRVLAGLHPYDAGGFTVTPPDGHDDAVILVFQDYMLFPHLTVRDNVAFGLRARGMGRRQRMARAGDMLADFAIGELAHRYPAHLSAGQRQRVALARALVCNPALLLLDEPFANLDRTLRLEMAAYVRDTVRRYGVTTLSVTHDLEEAFAVSDRIGVMLHGRLAQFGTPAELYGRPVSLDVARFMGPVNVLDGPACTAFGLPLPGGCLCGGGDDCAPLALRPEGLAVIPDPDGPAVVTRAVFTGQVTRLAPAPARAADGPRPGLPELVVHTLRADMPEGTRVRVELA
ncbi:ATP-binding cassette domain-containing protein [Nitratidesulfovibrio liaohensis]|uniref:ATP-binding cassette domain-containing protein n=1 Tax=Nitratidesulfovibrio liaohensis TaxID=2604158 RepID=A0ABY9QZ68_9BACT|nr:ATP-binding cassette domain-containing protein [Nitratidesulfovibrio liaohensis]WMW64182.1 ATP-binding cassette domain-containing protein [Nitratidesulfovibrio liaohensis]